MASTPDCWPTMRNPRPPRLLPMRREIRDPGAALVFRDPDSATRWHASTRSPDFGFGRGLAVDKDTGERLYLFSIETGEPVLPISCPQDAPWQIVAVSLETSCVESSEGEPDWAVIFALENWLAKIAEAISHCCPAGEVDPVATGNLTLAPGKRIAVEEEIGRAHV